MLDNVLRFTVRLLLKFSHFCLQCQIWLILIVMYWNLVGLFYLYVGEFMFHTIIYRLRHGTMLYCLVRYIIPCMNAEVALSLLHKRIRIIDKHYLFISQWAFGNKIYTYIMIEYYIKEFVFFIQGMKNRNCRRKLMKVKLNWMISRTFLWLCLWKWCNRNFNTMVTLQRYNIM